MRRIVARGVAVALGATVGLLGVTVATAGADETAPSDEVVITIDLDPVLAPLRGVPLRGIPLRGIPLRGVEVTVSLTTGTFKGDVLTY